jgi:hypothetical protein
MKKWRWKSMANRCWRIRERHLMEWPFRSIAA